MMSLPAAVLDAMLAAGCSAEQIVAAVKAAEVDAEARREAKRANNAERQRRFKARRKEQVTQDNAGNALPSVTSLDKKDPHTPKKINPISPPISPKNRNQPVAKPDDVSAQVWGDWLALRKSKRAPVSPSVIDGARREAAKLGWTLEAMLSEWVFRGSQGFKAEWISEHKSTGPPGEKTFLDHVIERQKRQSATP